MDFGDILDQWEGRQSGGSGANSGALSGANSGAKKTVARNNSAEPVSAPKANPIDVWLRINGVHDKDAEAEHEAWNRAGQRRRLHTKRPDAVIDIHGLTRDEAWEALERFFAGARERGFEKLLVIHGKGNHSQTESVLKRAVRDFIERCPFAGESGYAKPAAGGSGATWVLLKETLKNSVFQRLLKD
jgi:DNA-nicking Smr family endonuclease